MTPGLCGAARMLVLVAGRCLLPAVAAAQWLDFDVPDRPVADAAAVEAGRSIYEMRCWFCHGDDGDGNGPVAPQLWPRPRDFTVGSYKLRTTESGELPTDEDLFRTISLGIPGTAMPEWQSALSVEERWQVIAYVKTFAADLFEDEAFDPYQFVVEVGSGPPNAEVSLAEGERVYEESDCWECHGAKGRGDGERAGELTDDLGLPILPANLHLGWSLKGGGAAREIYLRFSTGLDGTPMPSYAETVSEADRWQLANYVASLREDVESSGSGGAVIVARRIDGPPPSDPEDPAWESAPEIRIPLTGQATFAPRWQIPAVTDMSVRAVYTSEEIALRIVWDDRFADTTAVDSAAQNNMGATENGDTYPILYPRGTRVRGRYPDAVEIMFPVRAGGRAALPHFVYGSAGQPVDLWRWRAEHQSSGNDRVVVELRATGASLPAEPHGDDSQQAMGTGVWRDGRWSVVIRRPLRTEHGAGEVQFDPGALVPVAFHVWEGANGETGLRMALSSWYFVHLREPVRVGSYLLVLLGIAVAAAVEYGLVLWMGARAAAGQFDSYTSAELTQVHDVT